MIATTLRMVQEAIKKATEAKLKAYDADTKSDINAKDIEQNTSEIEFASESIESIMTDTLPTQNATLDEVADAIETIMTQILPSLMTDNE